MFENPSASKAKRYTGQLDNTKHMTYPHIVLIQQVVPLFHSVRFRTINLIYI